MRLIKSPTLDETDLERVLRDTMFKTLGEIFGIDGILPIEELKKGLKKKLKVSPILWL